MIDSEVIAKQTTLGDCLNEYLAVRQIDKRKYYPSYLIVAKQVFKRLFENTIFATTSVWKTVKAGDPYPYIDVPKDAQRIFSIGIEDHCGDIKPIYYDNRLNVIPKPKEKKCGCDSCNCGGLCETVNSTVLTTKAMFTINGQTYYENIYVKYCPNGDIIEYRETPTKKYNDFRGDGGDYGADYNGDYSTGNPAFSNFDIVINTNQRTICKLDTMQCGCPVDTPENEAILLEHCGCFLPLFGHHRRRHCDNFLRDDNTAEYGSVKLSPCQTKIFFRPGRHHHHHHEHKRIPDFLLVVYQSGGDAKNITEQVTIPDVAAYKEAVWAGIDFGSKRYNNKYSSLEKREAKYARNEAENELIGYLNPLSMQDLGDIADNKILW